MANKVVAYSSSNRMLQFRGVFMLGMLVAEFIIGMTLGLFIHLPESHPGTEGSFISRCVHGYGWAITNGGGMALTLHIIFATLLVLGSIATLIFSIAAKHKAWIIASVFGLVGVWVAFLTGLEFINSDNDKQSMIMALGFLLAFIAYGAGLYFGKSSQRG